MMVTDKLTATHQLSEQLSKLNGKASFMPAQEIGSALQYLEEKGIPNAKVEEYKYCNIEAIVRKEFKAISGKERVVEAKELKNKYSVKNAFNIFLVNGKFLEADHDVPNGAIVLPIEKTPAEILNNYLTKYAVSNSDPLIALNTAYCDRGFFLHIKKQVEKPVYIHHIHSSEGNLFFNSRNLVLAEKNSEVKIVELYHSCSDKFFHNEVTEISVEEHAHCTHTIVQDSGKENHSVKTTKVNQATKSNYTNLCYTFSGALVRNNLNTAIDGEFAEAHLYGLFVTNGTQLVDNHTLVDHLKPNCISNELYKGIAAGRSTAVFNGQIFVERDAQKTNAYQSSKNILLSDDATVDAKPELEIYANDVKCSHGTSTGKVDEQALFYLKARGIGEKSAQKLLLHAFAHEVTDQISIEELKEKVVALFENSLPE